MKDPLCRRTKCTLISDTDTGKIQQEKYWYLKCKIDEYEEEK